MEAGQPKKKILRKPRTKAAAPLDREVNSVKNEGG
jgi:hypothetical protein